MIAKGGAKAELIRKEGDIAWIRIENEDVRIITVNLGCRICALYTPDREGKTGDILLGYRDVRDCLKDDLCMGAVVGRVANRIRYGRFRLNGTDYELSRNGGAHHLHGGNQGFDKKIFSWELTEGGVRYTLLSADGEEGYPGNLRLNVTYLLEGYTLKIIYDALADRDTLLNVTSHMYFNLNGSESVLDHELQVDADRFYAVGSDGIPEGRSIAVDGTPFDFREFHAVGERIGEECTQLRNVSGYDHPFKLKGGKDALVLRERQSGRTVRISTDMPVVQVYSANFIAGDAISKNGRPFRNREGIALETEFLPDSVNIEQDPPVILRAGRSFHSETDYSFRTE